MEGSPDRRTDGELLVATGSDPEAFAVFYRRHVRGVLSFYRRRVPTAEVAFDLTAEAFAAALEAAPRYELRPDPARGWLYGIAWNKLHEAQRRGGADDATRRQLGMAPLTLTDEGLERIEGMAGGRALRLSEALPAEQRDAVRARALDERAYEAIAGELQCSSRVVRRRVSAGIQTIPPPARGGRVMNDDPIARLERELVAAAERHVSHGRTGGLGGHPVTPLGTASFQVRR